MSATDPVSPDTLLFDLLAAAPTACAAIAGAEGWTVQPADATPVPDGWRVVEATTGAVVVHLLVDPELARHLQVGPPPADDLAEGAAGPLQALAAALGHPLPLADVREISAAEVVRPGHDHAVVAALDGDVHRASFGVLQPAAPVTAARPAPTPSAAPTAPRLAAVPSGLELLHDVELAVTVELGRTRMLVRDVLELVPGSVIELDRAAGSPVDVLVNGTMIARGEVVVIDEEFGVRITEVIGYGDDAAH
jgi:flagellar motor switch protein FliN/FliY